MNITGFIIIYCLVVAIVFGKEIPMKSTSSLTENSSQKDRLLKDALDQLYKETMIRLEIEKKIRILESEVLNRKADDRKVSVNQANGQNESQANVIPSFGFYAYGSRNLSNPGGDHTIVYDVVKSNFDNGYNQYTGIFTVPIDGIYSFTWVTRVECSEAYTSQLLVNKDVVGSTYAWCGYNTVTGNAIVTVSKGDAVFVRTRVGMGKGMIRSNEYGRSSSGFILT